MTLATLPIPRDGDPAFRRQLVLTFADRVLDAIVDQERRRFETQLLTRDAPVDLLDEILDAWVTSIEAWRADVLDRLDVFLDCDDRPR